MQVKYSLSFCLLVLGQGWILRQPKIPKEFQRNPKGAKRDEPLGDEPMAIHPPLDPIFDEIDAKDEVCLSTLIQSFAGTNLAMLSVRSTFDYDFPEDGFVISAGAPPYPDFEDTTKAGRYVIDNWRKWLNSPWCFNSDMQKDPEKEWTWEDLAECGVNANEALLDAIKDYDKIAAMGVYKNSKERSYIVPNKKKEAVLKVAEKLRKQFSQESFLYFSACANIDGCVRRVELNFGPNHEKPFLKSNSMLLGTIGVFDMMPENIDAYLMVEGKYHVQTLSLEARQSGFLQDSRCQNIEEELPDDPPKFPRLPGLPDNLLPIGRPPQDG